MSSWTGRRITGPCTCFRNTSGSLRSSRCPSIPDCRDTNGRFSRCLLRIAGWVPNPVRLSVWWSRWRSVSHAPCGRCSFSRSRLLTSSSIERKVLILVLSFNGVLLLPNIYIVYISVIRYHKNNINEIVNLISVSIFLLLQKLRN